MTLPCGAFGLISTAREPPTSTVFVSRGGYAGKADEQGGNSQTINEATVLHCAFSIKRDDDRSSDATINTTTIAGIARGGPRVILR